MRHRRIALVTLLCGAATWRPSYAAKPSEIKRPMEHAASGRTEPKRPELQHRSPAKLPLPSKPHPRQVVASAANPHSLPARSAFTESTSAEKDELTPIRGRVRPSLPRPAESPLSSVRHRGLNPPAIGGSFERSKQNTAGLDGREVHRRF